MVLASPGNPEGFRRDGKFRAQGEDACGLFLKHKLASCCLNTADSGDFEEEFLPQAACDIGVCDLKDSATPDCEVQRKHAMTLSISFPKSSMAFNYLYFFFPGAGYPHRDEIISGRHTFVEAR